MTATIQAQAPFIDTRPEDLTYSTSTPILPALATKTLGQLEMRVLGASHQIRIGNWIETLACQQGRSPNLPRAIEAPGYKYQCEVQQHTPESLASEVASITEHVQATGGLAVAFQGDPLALTGIVASECQDRYEWQTWHVYPTAQQIVTTRSQKKKEK